MSYRIAAHLDQQKDLTRIDTESHFARCLKDLFARIRPKRVIETGTYHGTGTTTVIARALRDLRITDSRFISIEVNPRNVTRASANLQKEDLVVELFNGLTVPRALLPSIEQIDRELVKNVLSDDLIVDHEEADRARLYFGETDFSDLPDDMLGTALDEFDGSPDFVLLDSGGHMGYVEFKYLVSKLRGPCHIALDDIYHVKHFRSFGEIRNDKRFQLVAASEEKFGFCIATFNPAMMP